MNDIKSIVITYPFANNRTSTFYYRLTEQLQMRSPKQACEGIFSTPLSQDTGALFLFNHNLIVFSPLLSEQWRSPDLSVAAAASIVVNGSSSSIKREH